jgi:hypothetical protein
MALLEIRCISVLSRVDCKLVTNEDEMTARDSPRWQINTRNNDG